MKHGCLLVLVMILTATVSASTKGILPENDMFIPVGSKLAGGLTEDQFNKAIDRVEKVYKPIISKLGGELVIERKWTDGTVNAYAQRNGNKWMVSMFGGLARHKTITPDAMSLVVCHEIGHHIGGAPKIGGYDWASNEGQADYWAASKCMRKVFGSEKGVKSESVPATVTKACESQWAAAKDRDLCARGSMAGDSVAKLFAALGSEKPAQFDTPDKTVVDQMDDEHPATQCRLDTYFQGSLCKIGVDEPIDQADEVKGTCHPSKGFKIGNRPLCWFKPSVE